jgi:hypothetical protein
MIDCDRSSVASFGTDTVVYAEPAPTGVYYVGVDTYDHSPATYYILAHLDCASHDYNKSSIVLQDGVPQQSWYVITPIYMSY